MMFIPLLLVGIAIYYFARNKDTAKFFGKLSSEETLKERYVNEEIDDETYKKMKETLK